MIDAYDRYPTGRRPGVAAGAPEMRRNDSVNDSYDAPTGQSLLQARARRFRNNKGPAPMAKPGFRNNKGPAPLGPNDKGYERDGYPGSGINPGGGQQGMPQNMQDAWQSQQQGYGSQSPQNQYLMEQLRGADSGVQQNEEAMRAAGFGQRQPANPMNTRMGGGFGSNLETPDGSGGRPVRPPTGAALLARRRSMPRNPGAPAPTVMPQQLD